MDAAQRTNAAGPLALAQACAEQGVRLIHISTDFVFDGTASQPYKPDAGTAPLGEYGRSKRAGELAVQSVLPAALILRTGWVYSRYGGNFVKTMLRLMSERDELAVVADQVGTPTWAHGLAEAVWACSVRPQLPIAAIEYPTPACRPAYSVLDKTNSWRDFAIAGVHWRQQLRAMLEDYKALQNE